MKGRMNVHGVPPEALVILLVAAVVIAAVQSLRLAWQGFSRRRTMAIRRERGADGEKRAEKLLEDCGFGIWGRQVAVSYDVLIDNEPVAIDLRADYLVTYRDKRYIAEVKTGRSAPKIDTPATRRQLLEYRIAFDVDGVLLVDAEAERIHAVEFPLGIPEAPKPSRLAWLLAGILLGALFMLLR